MSIKKIKPENPLAYPTKLYNENGKIVGIAPGMDLLDYFAAKAMNGCADMGRGHEKETAKRSYDLAEAMLNERQKRKQ